MHASFETFSSPEKHSMHSPKSLHPHLKSLTSAPPPKENVKPKSETLWLWLQVNFPKHQDCIINKAIKFLHFNTTAHIRNPQDFDT
jgi:hypothetical protein